MHLKKPQDDNGEITARTFGLLFHDAAELYYKTCVEKGITNIKKYNNEIVNEPGHKTLRAYIHRAFQQQEEVSEDRVITETLLEYILNLLRYDSTYEYLEIKDLEKDASLTLQISVKGKTVPFQVGGRIDRVDICTPPHNLLNAEKQEASIKTLRIVDYKTGAKPQYGKSIADIFNSDSATRPYYFFQTYLYALTQQDEATKKNLQLSAALFFPHLAGKKGYDPWIGLPCPSPTSAARDKHCIHVITSDQLTEFRDSLQALIEDIFDTSKDFDPTTNEKHCIHCDFRQLCGLSEKP